MEWFNRLGASLLLGGQTFLHLAGGRIHRRNTFDQLSAVGLESLLIVLLTAVVISGVFTIQVAREFINFGASSLIGGVLAIALSRELTPVVTAVIMAGRIGSAFAAELGTMKVTEQIDALQLLRTDPVDYLVIPRVLACGLMLPVLTMLSLLTGLIGGMIICATSYSIAPNQFLDSAQTLLSGWDLIACMIKALTFGSLIAVVGSGWGLSTSGGAKGVGKSTTDAVVTALLGIFVSNFFLSWILFQGPGQALSDGF
ncbi:MAG: MlaE family lipid ABC transporter permease subunit [Cyanobacteriota bacterium]|nr:MlaE family lipid ABC transporter permease subunit [Cyanobacteriota bacterium]